MHKEYIDKFLMQAEKFVKYGKEPNKEGYQKRYDYGGKGQLHDDQRPYEMMAKDLIKILLKEQDYDVMNFIKRWRGKSYNQDPRYYKAVINMLKNGK
jgi:hypothetical protein